MTSGKHVEGKKKSKRRDNMIYIHIFLFHKDKKYLKLGGDDGPPNWSIFRPILEMFWPYLYKKRLVLTMNSTNVLGFLHLDTSEMIGWLNCVMHLILVVFLINSLISKGVLTRYLRRSNFKRSLHQHPPEIKGGLCPLFDLQDMESLQWLNTPSQVPSQFESLNEEDRSRRIFGP